MICISITAETTDKAIEEMNQAAAIADLIEIRADYIKDLDLDKIIRYKTRPVIITIMPKYENGRFEDTEEKRVALLQQAVQLGADYIDVNLDCPSLGAILERSRNTKVIVSYHNFKETPSHLDEVLSRIQSTGADIIKIATFAKKLSDNLKILDLIKKSDRPIIGICMGEYGEISRILAPLYGSYLTFTSLQEGKESAPGQIPAETVKNIYRIHELKPGFSIYGIIGNPVNKSRGYIIHNALFRRYTVNALYLNFLVDDIGDFMHNFTSLVDGFSVTMPHKQQILRFLDKIDPVAEQIGAVNTVVKKHGELKGFNTDMSGAVRAIEEKTEVKNKHVTVLGAGGAGRAIAFGVAKKGGLLTILNRTVTKAKELARELNCHAGALSDFKKIHTDILINTTSVGMDPHINEAPIDTRYVHDMLVFDAIYNPEKTLLLKEAEKHNCPVISGVEMFVYQASEQFAIWSGIYPDTSFLREVLQ